MAENPLFELLKIAQQGNSDVPPSWTWGTVLAGGSVQLDGSDLPLASTPDSLVSLSAGDRVYVQIYQRRAVVLGKKMN